LEVKLKVLTSPSSRSSGESDVRGEAEGPDEPLEPVAVRTTSEVKPKVPMSPLS